MQFQERITVIKQSPLLRSQIPSLLVMKHRLSRALPSDSERYGSLGMNECAHILFQSWMINRMLPFLGSEGALL